jgi:uncharacterized membrane protein YbhN (UPF0104 family)
LLEILGRMRDHRVLAVGVFSILVLGAVAVWFTARGARAGLTLALTVDPRDGAAAVLGCVVSLVASATVWRICFQALGARVSGLEACGRYAAGSLVNAVSPARLGDGVRTALFARSLEGEEGRLTLAVGALGAVAICRAVAECSMIALGAALGAVPIWPVAVVLATAGGIVATALWIDRRHRAGSRFARLAGAIAMIAQRPGLYLRMLFWAFVAIGGQVAAAAAIAAGLGVKAPLLAGLVMIAALDLAAALPITPGGLGIASGAVSLALLSRGVDLPVSVAAGVTLQAVTTVSSLAFAGVVLPLAARPSLARHAAIRVGAVVAVAGSLAIVGRVLVTGLT